MQEEPDPRKFHHGVVGNPPVCFVVQIPIAEYAEQGPDGLDMFYGKMKRIEVIGGNLIREAWARRQRSGVAKPNLAVS